MIAAPAHSHPPQALQCRASNCSVSAYRLAGDFGPSRVRTADGVTGGGHFSASRIGPIFLRRHQSVPRRSICTQASTKNRVDPADRTGSIVKPPGYSKRLPIQLLSAPFPNVSIERFRWLIESVNYCIAFSLFNFAARGGVVSDQGNQPPAYPCKHPPHYSDRRALVMRSGLAHQSSSYPNTSIPQRESALREPDMNANGFKDRTIIARRRNNNYADQKNKRGDWLAAEISRIPVSSVVEITGMTETAVQNIRRRKSKISHDNLCALLEANPEFRTRFFVHVGGELLVRPDQVVALERAINSVMRGDYSE